MKLRTSPQPILTQSTQNNATRVNDSRSPFEKWRRGPITVRRAALLQEVRSGFLATENDHASPKRLQVDDVAIRLCPLVENVFAVVRGNHARVANEQLRRRARRIRESPLPLEVYEDDGARCYTQYR